MTSSVPFHSLARSIAEHVRWQRGPAANISPAKVAGGMIGMIMLSFAAGFTYCLPMHGTILRMISTGSLAAFSASVAQAGFGQVQQVRSAGGPTLQTSPPTQASPPVASGGSFGTAPSGRILPRGSLLDLSV